MGGTINALPMSKGIWLVKYDCPNFIWFYFLYLEKLIVPPHRILSFTHTSQHTKIDMRNQG